MGWSQKIAVTEREVCVENSQENYCNRTRIRPGIDKQLSSIKGKVAIWRKSPLQNWKTFWEETVGTEEMIMYAFHSNRL